MKEFLKSFYDHFTNIEIIEWWFKWLSWITLTAAISYAWWHTKSMLVLPVILISFWYVWHSSFRGIAVFLRPYLLRHRFKKEVINPIIQIVGLVLTLYFFIMLILLFVGLFKSVS